MEEVSSSGAVIEMQEFSDSDDNTYEVPVPPSSAVLDGLKPVGFVYTSTNTETVHLYPVPFHHHLLKRRNNQELNDQTLPKTVAEEHDPYPHIPPKGWLSPDIFI